MCSSDLSNGNKGTSLRSSNADKLPGLETSQTSLLFVIDDDDATTTGGVLLPFREKNDDTVDG